MSYRSLWQKRNFRLLFAASIGTNLGDRVLAVALPSLASLLTRDPFLIGLVTLARTLPLVVDPHQLERANGQMWAAEQVGVMIALSLLIPFGFFPTMLRLSLILTWRLHLRPIAVRAQSGFLPVLGEGLRHLFSRPDLRRLAMVLGMFNFLHFGVVAVQVLYAQNILGLGAIGFGTLVSAQAVGGFLGSLLGPAAIARLGSAALQLPYALAAGGAVLMMLYAARFLRTG